ALPWHADREGLSYVRSTVHLSRLPLEEQARMRAILRRTRYGYLLAFPILLLCAAAETPQRLPSFCFARAPAYTGSCGHSAQGTSAYGSPAMAGFLCAYRQVS